MPVDFIRDRLHGLSSVVGWSFWLVPVALLIGWVPTLVRRLMRAEATSGQRVAAVVLVVSAVAACAYASLPFSEGPYRCTSVLAGAEGRQTVYPDDAPRATGTLELLQRRQQVCDDAAKARGVTSGVILASGLMVSFGIGFAFRRTVDKSEPQPRNDLVTI
jgi:hypothetical protein